jgi:hypothetical protein
MNRFPDGGPLDFEAINSEPDADKRRELMNWHSLILTIGYFGEQKNNAFKADWFREPLEQLSDKLRSGKGVPALIAPILAELIDQKHDLFSHQLRLVPIPKKVKEYETGALSITIGKEIEHRHLDYGSINKAVSRVSEDAGVDERTIWRHWKRFKEMYPEGFLKVQEFPDWAKRLLRDAARKGTDKT